MDQGIKMEEWGKDHWGTFMYIEKLCTEGTEGIGVFNKDSMRCDQSCHPKLIGPVNNINGVYDGGKTLPTRLKNRNISDHDDWDCVNDMESYGLVKIMGFESNPACILTKTGAILSHELRRYMVNGGSYEDFMPGTKCKQLNRLQMLEDSETSVNLMLGIETIDELDISRGYRRPDSPDATV